MAVDPPVHWGVLGTAEIARTQVIPAIFAASNGTVTAVSSSSGRAADFAAALGIPVAHSSHEALLADPDVTAVYIPLPNSLHVQWALKAARAGKHVLCEKSIAMKVDELRELHAVCVEHGVHYAEAFMYRYHPQYRRLHELIAADAIGELVSISARLHFELDRSAGPNIRLNPALGGGALRDLGCYPLDLFSSLTGMVPDTVKAIAVPAGRGAVDESIAAVLRYGSVLATLDCSFNVPFVNSATVLGTHGRITLPDVFRADLADGVGTLILETGDGRSEFQEVGDQYRLEIEEFSNLLLHDAASYAFNRQSELTLAATELVAEATTRP